MEVLVGKWTSEREAASVEPAQLEAVKAKAARLDPEKLSEV
jgi:hypothetical protein